MLADRPTPSTEEAVAFLRTRVPSTPRIGLVLGSGLGTYANSHPARASVDYADIPGFPSCTVEGHPGRMVFSEHQGLPIVIMEGRVHRYEGYSLEEVTRPVRLLHALGIDILILSCAAGGLGEASQSQILLVQDHLNLLGDNPLIGAQLREGRPGRFVEMSGAYDTALLQLAESEARNAGLTVNRGVLACVPGPTYETQAEATMLRRLGADAVSMSTVPEVIVARALNLRVLAFALVTNQAGVLQTRADLHRTVLETGARLASKVQVFLDGVLAKLAQPKS